MRHCNGHHRQSFRGHGGYIFLLSVLFVGAIAATAAATIVLLGIGAGKSGDALSKSEQALQNAQTCVERALLSLRSDANYAGNETLTITRGTCTLMSIGGSGNQNRIICARGAYRSTTRRVEVRVATLLPRGTIDSWQEVSSFILCSA